MYAIKTVLEGFVIPMGYESQMNKYHFERDSRARFADALVLALEVPGVEPSWIVSHIELYLSLYFQRPRISLIMSHKHFSSYG